MIIKFIALQTRLLSFYMYVAPLILMVFFIVGHFAGIYAALMDLIRSNGPKMKRWYHKASLLMSIGCLAGAVDCLLYRPDFLGSGFLLATMAFHLSMHLFAWCPSLKEYDQMIAMRRQHYSDWMAREIIDEILREQQGNKGNC